ncbi:hypothetical protein IWW48_002509 [Coemansia sp. RSA 1200]|nr:hypothetical protein IWW48_002509 [Coemansia sp. RSA 1200]
MFNSMKKISGEISYPCTFSLVKIPAIPISADIVRSAGRWGIPLLRRSTDASSAGNTISAECIMHISNTSIPKSKSARKAILYFHGGSYIMGCMDSYRGLHSRLVAATQLPVYSVEYCLAPESKYPAQLYDAYCAYMHLCRNLGYKACDIVVAGDSAGSNLTLALWQLVRAHNEPIGALILVSPWVDISYTRETWYSNAKIDYLQRENVDDPESSVRKLLGYSDLSDESQKRSIQLIKELARDPFVAPIYADLTELPPTLIQVGELEAMYSDICEFAARAIESVHLCKGDKKRGPVELQVLPDGVHSFYLATPDMRGVDKFWQNIGTFIQSLG